MLALKSIPSGARLIRVVRRLGLHAGVVDSVAGAVDYNSQGALAGQGASVERLATHPAPIAFVKISRLRPALASGISAPTELWPSG